MAPTEGFPWDLLKAECLRLVCTQLVQGSNEGGPYQGPGRKEEMINFLRDVEELGLEPAIKKIDIAATTPRKTGAGSDQSDGGKRKGSRLEDGSDAEGAEGEGDSSDLTHNTRFKGAKRVKLTKEDPEKSAPTTSTPRKSGPGRHRKSTEATPADAVKRGRGRPRKSDATPKDEAKDEEAAESGSAKKPKGRPRKSAPPTDENGVPIKRGRGRPRKVVEDGATASAPPSKGKAVFDGVLLNKRRSSQQEEAFVEGEGGEQSEAKQGGDGDGDGEAVEEDAVLAVVNGLVAQGDASSLGGSNKENDPNDMIVGDDHDADADADADGDPDPQVAVAA